MAGDTERVTPGAVDDAATRVVEPDGDSPTQIFERDPVPGDGALERVLQHRPTDRVGAQRVLANLEARLLGRHEPQQFGSRYLILGQIGVGGLGIVYAAYDPELDRRVALKFLHDHDVGERARERLVREAQAMARLSHPHVVTVYDVGTIDARVLAAPTAAGGATPSDASHRPSGPLVFIAMELVDGVPLSTWWSAKRRSWREIRDVMVQAGRGLLAAHEAGLVHRDFKPQNVLVGADGRARVLDFGLARRAVTSSELEAPPSGATTGANGEWADDRLTATGTIMGTPAYMAPEQLHEAEVGPAADQFSFCVALFEGLHRARPFRGHDLFSVRQSILEGRITAPPPGDVPAWLQRAVLRGLAPRPEDRFASMRDVIDAITRDLRVRRRYGLVLALAVCLVVAAVVGGIVWLRPAPSPEDLARIDELVATAGDAGERGDFVYPPIADPAAPTVYRVVRELEQLDGAASALARERATELRTRYAEALVELGDSYWQRDGGAPFAADYYAAALVFDETHPRARERASLTRGELAELIAKAERAGFSEGELAAAQTLAVLAEKDEDERARKYAVIERSAKPPSATTRARLDRLVRRERSASPSPSPNPSPNPSPGSGPGSGLRSGSGSGSGLGSDAERDREIGLGADALVDRGKALVAAGDSRGGERAFHRALQIDRRHVGALLALAQLHFDRGEYSDVLKYAARGVATAPKHAKLRILLGDAYLKVLAYDDARVQYEKAAALGHSAAKGRLELLRDKLGQ